MINLLPSGKGMRRRQDAEYRWRNPSQSVAATVAEMVYFGGGTFAPGFNGQLFLSVNE